MKPMPTEATKKASMAPNQDSGRFTATGSATSSAKKTAPKPPRTMARPKTTDFIFGVMATLAFGAF
jgi:transcription initiation factor TFIID subunit TAF12